MASNSNMMDFANLLSSIAYNVIVILKSKDLQDIQDLNFEYKYLCQIGLMIFHLDIRPLPEGRGLFSFHLFFFLFSVLRSPAVIQC